MKMRNFITTHQYKGTPIPLKVVFERRKNVRISIGRETVHLRIPYLIPGSQWQKHLDWSKEWMDQQFDKNPDMLERFRTKSYSDGDTLRVNGTDFALHFSKMERKSISARIEKDTVRIKVPVNWQENQIGQSLPSLLSRVFASHFGKEIEERIRTINDRYFREQLGDIRMKYNKSNWGSCSAKRNINISTRLLFAPRAVQDYVFVHELTHLKVLNHSPAFWRIVEKIDPDYKAKEKWLKVNSHHMDF